MISFDLQCQHAHVFEVWFRSSADHSEQASRGLIACPVCNDTMITKAVMAPNIGPKGNSHAASEHVARDTCVVQATTTTPSTTLASALPAMPPELSAALAQIAQMQAQALPSSRWVGRNFATEARALHNERDSDDASIAPIHGQATRDEADALAEDGIAIMPLLVPFTPPDMLN